MLIIFAILLFLRADSNVASPTRSSFNLDNLWIIVSFIVSFSLATGWADESYKQTERNNLRIAVIVDHQESWRRTNFGKLLPENHSFLPLAVEGASTFDFLKIR